MKTALQYFLPCLLLSHNLFSGEITFDEESSEESSLTTHAVGSGKPSKKMKGIVSSTFQIKLEYFETAFNPSIVKADEGYILTFRYIPDPILEPWISYIGAVLLDEAFQQISEPELLDLRLETSLAPSQTEDARIFSCDGHFYIIYNDNQDVTSPSDRERRDMYIAEVSYGAGHFITGAPTRLFHPSYYFKRLWEKNWAPFVWDKKPLLSYSISPHEVLFPDPDSGICPPCYFTPASVPWKWGPLRGGTPATLVDGEYLAFFHSAKELPTGNPESPLMWYYFMGAYTFSPNPPFALTKISPMPINDKSFYGESDSPKRVVYPGGYVISGQQIYIAYGKDDSELWIAVINKDKLMSTLRMVKQ